MNRPTTALLSALDALIAVAIGLGIPLVMLTILWATQFDLGVDWTVFWRASADLWMLGNGVDVLVSIDPTTAARLALTGAATPFEVGIAPLGFALLTVLLGRRSGLRLGLSPHPALGFVVGVATVAALSALVWLSAEAPGAVPSFGQALVLVPGVYALGAVAGLAESLFRARDPLAGWVREQFHRLPTSVSPLVAVALRGGAIVAAAMVAVGALATSLSLLIHYSTVISLYESLQSGIGGGAALTLGQLALLPNASIWASSWFLGPGFAIGTGSSVSPLATQVGLLPSLPLFGALPQSSPLGYAVLVVPVALGFVTAVALRPRLAATAASSTSTASWAGRMIGTGFGSGIVAASILSLLAVWSGGAAGPGRLADLGADPGAVWVWSTALFGVSASVGLLASSVTLPRGIRNPVGATPHSTSATAEKPIAKAAEKAPAEKAPAEKAPAEKLGAKASAAAAPDSEPPLLR